MPTSPRTPTATIGAPGGGTEEKLALDAGVPRDRVIVVPDGQSGLKMVQDGRIDAYSLPVLSINDLIKKANDPEPRGRGAGRRARRSIATAPPSRRATRRCATPSTSSSPR